jgi:hypothetical protein
MLQCDNKGNRNDFADDDDDDDDVVSLVKCGCLGGIIINIVTLTFLFIVQSKHL